ncbi:MAG: glutathione S-transferase family protein [Alphaproteobacteria bacterium]|nr:glutathione S-transferase family protein [Alphaproteobacteria bacterium]
MRVLHLYCLNTGARFCRLLLAEGKLDVLLKLEHFWEAPESFLVLNPAGTVPVMVEDDGTVLVGTWPIIEYLHDTQPELALLPGDPAQKAEARRLADWFAVKFEREVIAPLINEKLLRRLTGDGVPSSAVIRAALGNLSAHLEYINHLAEHRKWLAGSKLSIADLYAAAALSVVDYLGDVHWQDWPEAKTWYSRIKSRPSFRALLTDNVTGLMPPAHYTDLDF